MEDLYSLVAGKSREVREFLNKVISCKAKEIIIPLYIVIVRSFLKSFGEFGP